MDIYDVFPTMRPGYWYGDYDQQKLNEYHFFHDGLGSWLTLGYTRTLIDNDIATTKDRIYMERYGISPEDVVDPSNLYSSGVQDPATAALNYVSSNLNKLYRDRNDRHSRR